MNGLKAAGRTGISNWVVLLLAVSPVFAAQARERVRGELQGEKRFAMAGNVRPAIAQWKDLGPVSSSLPLSRMSIHFSMTRQQNAELLQLLRLQQTRHSAEFHKWLTPEQFADRFGLNGRDVEKVKAWLEGQGFTNVEAGRSRSWIMFDGTAGRAETAFHTSIHRYGLNDATHYANANAPELPSALEGMVLGVRGLHDFRALPRSHPQYTWGAGSYHFLVPDDFATIYDLKALYGEGIDGTGVTIAIPGQTDIDLADIAAFRAAAGLAVNVPTVMLDPKSTDPGISKGDLSEANLDIEWSGGIAKGAQIIYYNSKDVMTSEIYAINDNKAGVLAISYGNCDASYGAGDIAALNATFQQANAQGMTVIASAGDNGAAGCDYMAATATTPLTLAAHGLAVDFPASSPYVTGLGGTSLNGGASYWSTANRTSAGSALSYIPEVAWNDSLIYGSLAASAGGESIYNPKPTWQRATGVPDDGHRDVPDVSLIASPINEQGGYLVCSSGSCVNGFQTLDNTLLVVGGTSAASQTFAGIVALLIQKTGLRQGNINPGLYQLASVSTDAFHDIIAGDNTVACGGGSTDCSSTVAGVNGKLGYSTGPGYDLVTGLGSVDGDRLISEWTPDLETSIQPTGLTVARGTSGTAAVNVTETNFSADTTFTCSVSGSLTNTTCSIPGTVSGSGSSTLTITAGVAASGPVRPRVPTMPGGWLYLLASLMACSSAYLMVKKRSVQMWPAMALILTAGLSSCGSGSSNISTGTIVSKLVTPEAGIVTVVATSGSLTSNSTIIVTVQ